MEAHTIPDSCIKYIIRGDVRWYVMMTVTKFLDYSGHKLYQNYANLIEMDTIDLKQRHATRKTVIVKETSLRFILSKTRKAKAPELIKLLGFGDIIAAPTKETIHIGQIRAMFPRYDFQTQYKADKYKVDLYSPRYNIAVECDEFGHHDRDATYEAERQKKINEVLDNPSWVRFNPDSPSFSIVDVVAQITTIVDAKFDLCKCLL